MTALPDLLHERTLAQPNDIAIITADSEITWSRLTEKVDATVEQFNALLIQSGERIGFYSGNSVEYIIYFLAGIRMQTVAILFSLRFPKEMSASLADSLSCRIIEPVATNNQPSKKNKGSKTIAANQPSAVVFTSGTTNTPKAALLSYGNLYYNALGANERLPFKNGDRWLLSLPLYHVGGLGILFRALIHGGTVILPPGDMNLSDAITRFRPTHLSLVPTQLYRLLQTKQPTNTTVVMGGAPLSPTLAQKALDAGFSLYASYGLTEMGSQVCTQRITKINDGTIGCGKPLRYRELRIAATGEIQVKGDTLFQGYIETDNSLSRQRDSDGWFATGDIGFFDAAGSLHVTGRKDNMFISGGENIFPEEIESVLSDISGIAEAVVIPVTDPEFGARPVAFVRCERNSLFTEQELRNSVEATQLPRFKLPMRIFEWPKDIPEQMKPDRRFFKQRADELMRKVT